MPWKINGSILRLMREVQRLDLGIADVPLQKDPEVVRPSAWRESLCQVPPVPSPDLPEEEQKQARARHSLYMAFAST